ncbi:MAG TPA: hypothetical protein PLA53_00585 [bacterium]|jgi:hypothetical protein|nr:hypothetical protein [bacterium]HOQ91425.1 hypothetical protein [bacterium]HPL22262.1 hypothetical protein [bacterium]HPX63921.1 hypothetical protein [bacterium]HQA84170.1 hypothetical protein [bacterium]
MRNTIALILLVILLAGCSVNRNTTRAEIRLHASSQQLLAVNASGSMPVNDWLETRSQQSLVETKVNYLTRAQQAATPAESQQWLDLAAQVGGGGSTTLAILVNASDYWVTVLDGPYAGIRLAPGASSRSTARVPVGWLSFVVAWGDNQRASIVRPVSAGQKAIVIVNKQQ